LHTFLYLKPRRAEDELGERILIAHNEGRQKKGSRLNHREIQGCC
jgi:hypothetical protein